MIDVMHKICAHADCMTRPYFNTRGEPVAKFCKEHADPDMINVKDRTCAHGGYMKMPSFNTRGETVAKFCKKHADPDMINVKDRTCAHGGCTTRPSYGIPGNMALYCAEHKRQRQGVIKNPRKKCRDCKEWSTHGIRAPERCQTHAWVGDLNLVEHACNKCGLTMQLVNGVCEYCDETTAKRTRLAKQREVVQYLDVNMNDIPYTSVDKIPTDVIACGDRERPDVLWNDLPDRAIILEIDEDQHKTRPCRCEQTRMINISNDLGAQHTFWIRYNPDSYKSVHPSFSNKTRPELLNRWIRMARSMDLKHAINIVYFFYDKFVVYHQPIETLDIF